MTALSLPLQTAQIPPIVQYFGRVTKVTGQTVQIAGLNYRLGLGDQIKISIHKDKYVSGEIIALESKMAIAILFEPTAHIQIGQAVCHIDLPNYFPSKDWIGRVLNHEGRDISGQKPKNGTIKQPLKGAPPDAILRKALGPRLTTGIAAIDTFLPLCQGQRIGLFAGSGVGKSTLLGNMARHCDADIIIIALVGERGREVRHFVDKTLGKKGMEKSIVFAATSDMAAALKLRTANLAIATAEYFRDQGLQVLLLLDSLTRYAEAHREVALNAGEMPALKAYPPSTFNALAALCERTGPGLDGSGDITAIFSVLVAGSNMEEPVADMVRGILDGHVVMTREIAERGRFPAIDIRQSVSRSLPDAAKPDENVMLQQARAHIMRYEDAAAIIQAGLYVPGSDPALDDAIAIYPELDGFIAKMGHSAIDEAFAGLREAMTPHVSKDAAPKDAAADSAPTNAAPTNAGP